MTEKNRKFIIYYCTTLNKSSEGFDRFWSQQYTISCKYAISSARRIFLQL